MFEGDAFKRAGLTFSESVHVESGSQQAANAFLPAGLGERSDLTLVAADSGLGGLAVVAGLARALAERCAFEHGRLIFLNAKPEPVRGFNMMSESDPEQPPRVLGRVLDCMERHFQADLMLLPCNTLSVLLPQACRQREGEAPCMGIVEHGVDAMGQHLAYRPEAQLLGLATDLTVRPGVHARRLAALGWRTPLRYVPCPKLASLIERHGLSEPTRARVREVARASAEGLDRRRPLGVALLCTHYPYVGRLIRESYGELGFGDVTLIDPNARMACAVAEAAPAGRFTRTRLSVEVHTQVPISPERGRTVGEMVRATWPDAAAALENHTWHEHLFDID